MDAVLHEVDANVLVLALTGSSEELVDRITAQMPKRTAKAFRRQLRKPGPTRLSDVESAQQIVADAAAQIITRRANSHKLSKKIGAHLLTWPRSSAKTTPAKSTSGASVQAGLRSASPTCAARPTTIWTPCAARPPRSCKQAHQQAEQIRRQAEVAGRKAAEAAVERMLDEKVAKRMDTLLPALETNGRQLNDAKGELLATGNNRPYSVATAMAAADHPPRTEHTSRRSRSTSSPKHCDWPPAPTKSRCTSIRPTTNTSALKSSGWPKPSATSRRRKSSPTPKSPPAAAASKPIRRNRSANRIATEAN